MRARSHLLSVPLAHATPDLTQTLADEQDAINQQSIRRSFNLEVAEECIGAEEAQDFVERVVGLAIGIDGELIRAGGELRKGVGRTTSTSSEGQ